MRRESIRLRSLAKYGDKEAKLRLGEAYLAGSGGFTKDIPVGLEYLLSLMPHESERVSKIISRSLTLEEILSFQQINLVASAAAFDEDARLKLVAWLLVRGESDQAFNWLDRNDNATGDRVKSFLGAITTRNSLGALKAIGKIYGFSIYELAAREANQALSDGHFSQARSILRHVSGLQGPIPDSVHRLVIEVIRMAEKRGECIEGLPLQLVEASLEHCAAEGDAYACYVLGRALATLNCSHLHPGQLVPAPNLRKAAALLLRSGDGGIPQAWLDLFRICSDYRSSVGNPTLARFCLEKAAGQGLPEATRRLGAVVLREAQHITAMERGVALLFDAGSKGDALAKILLQSLVLPVGGEEAEVSAVLQEVEQCAPLLAMRLRLAREFGLTKLEALSINPSNAARPWGLMVGKNPFISKASLSEPRAVPAVSNRALECAEAAVSMFAREDGELVSMEGPLRARAQQQRRIFLRLGIDEDLVFARANSHQRDALRIGTRWAQRQKSILDQALV
jgi:hypothetical protein